MTDTERERPAPLEGVDLNVRTLGPCRHDSPLAELLYDRRTSHHWVDANDRVLIDDTAAMVGARGVGVDRLPGFEAGGPRRKIFFDPSKTRVGIVTCGGLCPGLNNVIRGLVMELTLHYGVHRILGFRNGYQGFIARYGYPVLDLTPDVVSDINEDGGTILGSSRGQQDPEEIVDCLEQLGVNILFVIGGDGSLHGAQRKSIRAAHIEARSAPGGVGLVKLMGRHSGFIACYAAPAKNDADYVLIPEVPFALDGEHGFLAHLRRTVRTQGHAVIIVAEGAGQEHLADEPAGVDAAAVHAGMAGRGGRRAPARTLRPHPDPGGGQPPQHGGPRRGPVALRARVDGPTRPVDAADAGAGAGERRLTAAACAVSPPRRSRPTP